MRRSLTVLLVMAVLVAGCGQRGAKPAPQAGAPAVSVPGSQLGGPAGGPSGTQPGSQPGGQAPVGADALAGPDLTAVKDPFSLTVEEFQAGLRRLANSADDTTAATKVQDVLNRWNLPIRGGAVRLAEADLNGDGAAEVALAFNSQKPEQYVAGQGALFVIYRKGDRWEVDRTEGEQPGMVLYGAHDLTEDGRPELVAASTMVGAHTAHSSVQVYQWAPGAFSQLPGRMTMASMRLTVDGSDLVLQGGTIGSVGAGPAQRERVDRYRWNGAVMVHVDRTFAQSAFGYHLLQDGITAEQFGRTDEAIAAYTRAMDPATEAAPTGWLPDETEARFPDAVRAFARMRLALLHVTQQRLPEGEAAVAGAEGRYASLPQALHGAKGFKQGASQVADWVRQRGAEFLEVINSPVGYANPQWQPGDLVGPLPMEGQ